MALIDFQYIKTGTGELSGPSFVAQTEQAINELGGFIEEADTTAEEALSQSQIAQQAAEQAQQTANSAVSDAQQSMAAAQTAQQAADQAQTTADNALEAAQNAGDEAGTKAPIMHASTATTYGAGSSTLYGHVQLSDATNGTENAASGGTAATPYAVAQAMTAAQTAQTTASSAQQVGNSAQQTANQAQSAAQAAQSTANSVQTSLTQAVENFNQQLSAIIARNLFTLQNSAIDVENYAGSFSKLYLTSSASSSTGLPSGISYPCFFWAEAGEDGNTSMMYVLSNNILYSQSGVNTTPDGATDTWSFTGWKKISYTAATTSALGVVKADGTTVEVAADGTLSINTNLLSQVYKFKGSVATVGDLPAGAAQGDVYNVTATDANYAWTGSAWDNIGGIEAVDSSPVQNSTNPVSSGGVYTALDNLKNNLEGQISAAGAQPSTSTPLAAGTASVGTQTAYARGDHRHPAQTSVSGNAGTATKLATARTIRTNLASTSTASFDGSANVTPGVTGILPVANGGTGNSTGTAVAATKATQDGNGNVISSTYATKTELSSLQTELEGQITAATVQPSTTTPLAAGTASVGTQTTYARGDHVHPAQVIPEYEGATSSAPGTSGLVPPAASAETESALCGDGTFRAFLQLAGGTMTGGLFGTAVALSGSAIDVSAGSCFTKTITASTTFTITGAPAGAVGCFSLILTNGGSRTVTWPSSVKWTEGTPPELASSGIDVITFLTADGGVTWYGVHSVQGAA